MVSKSRVMLLLRQLGEVTALAIAHCDLPVLAFHVLVMRLLFNYSSTVDAPDDLLKTVVARVNIVLAAILDGQTLLQICNAGRLEELFLLPDNSQLCRTFLI